MVTRAKGTELLAVHPPRDQLPRAPVPRGVDTIPDQSSPPPPPRGPQAPLRHGNLQAPLPALSPHSTAPPRPSHLPSPEVRQPQLHPSLSPGASCCAPTRSTQPSTASRAHLRPHRVGGHVLSPSRGKFLLSLVTSAKGYIVPTAPLCCPQPPEACTQPGVGEAGWVRGPALSQIRCGSLSRTGVSRDPDFNPVQPKEPSQATSISAQPRGGCADFKSM